MRPQRGPGSVECEVIRRRCAIDRKLHGGASAIFRVRRVAPGERNRRSQDHLELIIVR